MANLLIEIGNTALKAAWSEGVTLGKLFRYQGEKVMEYILSLTEREKPEAIAIISQFPLSEEECGLLRNECHNLIVLDCRHTEVLEGLGLPEHLTYDRAASIVAVRNMFSGEPCTLFDFGTTVTVDFLDAAGLYEGGNISPGCLTRFKALNRYTKTLPLLDIPEKVMERGDSVETSMESGVISGIMFEIEGYVRLHPENTVVFTGGDAIYFAKKMKNSIFVVCNLVLMGLAMITDRYVKENS